MYSKNFSTIDVPGNGTPLGGPKFQNHIFSNLRYHTFLLFSSFFLEIPYFLLFSLVFFFFFFFFNFGKSQAYVSKKVFYKGNKAGYTAIRSRTVGQEQ